MIKNKVLDLKIIFKIYLKIFQVSGFLFYKISENNFQKLFLKTIFQNYFQKQLSNRTYMIVAYLNQNQTDFLLIEKLNH